MRIEYNERNWLIVFDSKEQAEEIHRIVMKNLKWLNNCSVYYLNHALKTVCKCENIQLNEMEKNRGWRRFHIDKIKIRNEIAISFPSPIMFN